MEFSKKDKLLSLIFPGLTVIYGSLVILGTYHPDFWQIIVYGPFEYPTSKSTASLFPYTIIVGRLAIVSGLITGGLTIIFKINTAVYLKIQTIAAVITFLFWYLVGARIGRSPYIDSATIINTVMYFISVFISVVKMPDEASVRDRLIVLFSNPLLFALLKGLAKLLMGYFEKLIAV